eukprot:10009511-Ditylum_brightwellii.AAC.1
MVGFVDDTTGQTNIFGSNDVTPERLIVQIHGIQTTRTNIQIGIEVEEKQAEALNNLKQQSEELIRSLISENFDKLFKESEETKAKSTELGEWYMSFDAKQKALS